MGDQRVSVLRHASGGLPMLRRHGRDGALGGGQASSYPRLRRVSRSVGASLELARRRIDLQDQLGERVW